MPEFLEERLAVDVRMGARYGDSYAVEITETADGSEYRRLRHPYPRRRFRLSTLAPSAQLYDRILDLYHRAYGRYAGFRVRCLDDFSTAGETGTPTTTDQTLELVSAGVYQLQKAYGAGGTPLGIGRPVRTIFKPVANTTVVAIAGDTIQAADWSVVTTTGRVTFAADIAGTITAISKAAQAVITIGAHSYVTGMSVQISGVSGMTEINGLRAPVTGTGATTITVDIDSSAFSTYTSGGATHTRPQSGEAVTGGCQFDIPVRFDVDVDVGQDAPDWRFVNDIELVELLNP